MKIYSNGEMLQVPSCGAFDVYSTEEQVVGRWIDGKPLYKKTLIVQTSAGLNHLPLTGIDILADASGLYVYGRYNVPIQTYTGPQYGAEEFLAVFSEDGVLTYMAGSSAASRTAYITACYTKTTDQATIELPAALTVNQPLYTAAPQSAAQAELTVGIENEEV